MIEGSSGALRSNFLIDFNKKLKGKSSREDPELSEAIFLFIWIRNTKENEAGRIQSSPEQFPY